MKVSVYKNKQIMIVGQHCFDLDKTVVKTFLNQNDAADFIEYLALNDTKDEQNDSESI